MDTNHTPEQPATPSGRTGPIHRMLAARRAAAAGIAPENGELPDGTPGNDAPGEENRPGTAASATGAGKKSGSAAASGARGNGGRAPARNASSTQRGVSDRMTQRRRAREIAFQTLYQMDQNPLAAPTAGVASGTGIPAAPIGSFADVGGPVVLRGWLTEFIRRRLRLPEQVEFARSLVLGTESYRTRIDELIGNSATHWRIERMTATDRTILRLGAYELLHSPTPARVAVNEAVELAKRYGTAQSAAFVNGILDFLLRTHAHEKDAREQAARRKN